MAGVTAQQSILTPPWHQGLPLIFCRGPCSSSFCFVFFLLISLFVKAKKKISNQLMHNFTVWIFRSMLIQTIICLKFYKQQITWSKMIYVQNGVTSTPKEFELFKSLQLLYGLYGQQRRKTHLTDNAFYKILFSLVRKFRVLHDLSPVIATHAF